jgi:hypothetical protein
MSCLHVEQLAHWSRERERCAIWLVRFKRVLKTRQVCYNNASSSEGVNGVSLHCDSREGDMFRRIKAAYQKLNENSKKEWGVPLWWAALMTILCLLDLPMPSGWEGLGGKR